MVDFEFPPLGPTGIGPISEHAQGEVYWRRGQNAVAHQHDRPAVSLLCFYPGGSAPCKLEKADQFIEWAKNQVTV
jgi:hypothetical protein